MEDSEIIDEWYQLSKQQSPIRDGAGLTGGGARGLIRSASEACDSSLRAPCTLR